MSAILYEHPLNERIRNYLKLEQLFTQSEQSLNLPINVSFTTYFNALFSILDSLERNDIRGDLIKEIEKLDQNLQLWANAPEVDKTMLQAQQQQTAQLLTRLKTKETAWQQLKQDKLLDSIRKRFNMQAGCCTSDLPQLQFWLAQSNKSLINDCQQWLNKLALIRQSVDLVLKFIRQRSEFTTINTPTGFYQDNGDGVLLLRVKLAKNEALYPTISGNKYRFSIRFATPSEDNGQTYVNSAVNFDLARC